MTQFVPLLIYKLSRHAEEKGRALAIPEAIGQELRILAHVSVRVRASVRTYVGG